MGNDILAGQKAQFTVPTGVWQGGCLVEGGQYSLFGCTLAPGFTNDCFEGGIAEKLILTNSSYMTTSIYLAGWEAHFNGDQQCKDFIATQITNKETVESIWSGIELVFEQD